MVVSPRTLSPEVVAFGKFPSTDYVYPIRFIHIQMQKIIVFHKSGSAPRPSGARASHNRVTPTHGYVEPPLLQAWPNYRTSLFLFSPRPYRGIWRPNQMRSSLVKITTRAVAMSTWLLQRTSLVHNVLIYNYSLSLSLYTYIHIIEREREGKS